MTGGEWIVVAGQAVLIGANGVNVATNRVLYRLNGQRLHVWLQWLSWALILSGVGVILATVAG